MAAQGAVALALGLADRRAPGRRWTTQGFGPADGGYASVFFGWTAFQFLFVLGTLFWLETMLATSIRYRGPNRWPAAGEASGDPDRSGPDIADPVSLVRPSSRRAASMARPSPAVVARRLDGALPLVTGVLLNGDNWPLLEWPTAVAAVVAALYVRGGRLSAAPASSEKRWRGVAFYSGIATAVLAIGSPIDAYADRLFWAHMVQHVLLTMVAPPLVLLGRPWPRSFARLLARSAGRLRGPSSPATCFGRPGVHGAISLRLCPRSFSSTAPCSRGTYLGCTT